MIEEKDVAGFRSWQEQAGVEDLTLWDYLSFGVDMDLDVLAAVLSLAWPRLVIRDGCVLLADNCTSEDFNNWSRATGGDAAQIESQLNHVHINQLVSNGEGASKDLLAAVANVLCQLWRQRLAVEFPDRRFEVVAQADDSGWSVTFFRLPSD